MVFRACLSMTFVSLQCVYAYFPFVFRVECRIFRFPFIFLIYYAGFIFQQKQWYKHGFDIDFTGMYTKPEFR